MGSNRISKDEYYTNIALAVSKRSTCLKRHYGAVIVKDDVIVATGYNGAPRGYMNCCDRGTCKREDAARYSSYNECDSVHAEMNALIMVERSKLIGATLYLACETTNTENIHDPGRIWIVDDNPRPCPICCRMIKNSGINCVVNRNGIVYYESKE